jgi:hypothetical protein
MKEIEGLVDLEVDGKLILMLILRNMVSMSLFLLTRVRDQLQVPMNMQVNIWMSLTSQKVPAASCSIHILLLLLLFSVHLFTFRISCHDTGSLTSPQNVSV